MLAVTPRRIQRLLDERGLDLVRFESLVGYDWITPEISAKVEMKARHCGARPAKGEAVLEVFRRVSSGKG